MIERLAIATVLYDDLLRATPRSGWNNPTFNSNLAKAFLNPRHRIIYGKDSLPIDGIGLDDTKEELLVGLFDTKGQPVGDSILRACLLDPEISLVVFTGPPGVGKSAKRKQLEHALTRASSHHDIPFKKITLAEAPGIEALNGKDRGLGSIKEAHQHLGRGMLIIDTIPDLIVEERAIFTREIAEVYPLSRVWHALMLDAKTILTADDSSDTIELGRRAKKEIGAMATKEKLVEIRNDMHVQASQWQEASPDFAELRRRQIVLPPGYDPEMTHQALIQEVLSGTGSRLSSVSLASMLVQMHDFWKDNFEWKPEDIQLLAAHRHYEFIDLVGMDEDRYIGAISPYNHGVLHWLVNETTP